MKIKSILLLLLSILLLTSCNAVQNGNEVESSVLGVEDENKTITFKHNVLSDNSEPMEETTELEGERVTLSKKASEQVNKYSYPNKAFDTEDGNFVLFYITNTLPTSVDIIKLDTKTGKILEQTTADLLGSYIFSEFVIDKSVEGNIILGTSEGSFVFDLNNLSKEPTQYLVSKDFLSKMPVYEIKDNKLNQIISLEYEKLSVSPATKQVVYVETDGVYLADSDGKNAKKILDQPKDDIWVPETEGAEFKDETIYGKSVAAHFSKPRFNPDGSKIVLDIVNYEMLDPKVGLAVFDIASKKVNIIKLYDLESPLGATNEDVWKTQSGVWARGYTFLDNNTMVVTISGYFDGNTGRYDIFYNLTSNTVEKSFVNITGITSDYKIISLNESQKGASNELLFSDLEKEAKIMADTNVLMKNSLSSSMGISATKTYVQIRGTGPSEGTFYYIIVTNPSL